MGNTCASAFIIWNNPKAIIEYEHDIHGAIVLNDDGTQKVLSSTPSWLADLTEQEVCDTVLNMWVNSKQGRIGAVTYCISALGLEHLHMVLEVENSDSDRFTYKQVQKLYGQKFHIETTRGNKKDAEDYIYKRGRFAEKGEKVLAVAVYGDIKGNQGKRTDLAGVQKMIDDGLTPNQIMDESIQFRRYKNLIRDAYFRKRDKETSFVRDVRVFYHVGESGAGKTFESVKLMQEIGEDNLYFVAEYKDGFLDGYCGQRVLWMDEYRGQLPYSTFLSMLDVYKTMIHARYSNVLALWDEVHISTVAPPETIYANMVADRNQDKDSIRQLYRRIDKIIYHYKVGGEYKRIEQDMQDYTSYNDLVRMAYKQDKSKQFVRVSPDEEKRIEKLFGI